MELAIFCDSLSARGLLVGHFTLKNAELSCNLPLCGSPPPPTQHPYISACGVDKNLSKMAGNLVSYALYRGYPYRP